MRTIIFAALVMLSLLWQGSARAQTELECLTEAVLAESTLSRSETIVGDGIVAYSMYAHLADGRWGKTYCEVVNKKYAKKAYRTVKGKKGRTARRVAYTRYVCDYSYKCLPYYKDIVKKSPPGLVARAQLVAQIQLAGAYEPPEGFEESIDYLYPEKSSAEGKLWFACTAKPLGKIEPTSVHVMHREQTDLELEATLAARPECRRFITIFRDDRNQNRLRKALVEAK